MVYATAPCLTPRSLTSPTMFLPPRLAPPSPCSRSFPSPPTSPLRPPSRTVSPTLSRASLPSLSGSTVSPLRRLMPTRPSSSPPPPSPLPRSKIQQPELTKKRPKEEDEEELKEG